jgi:hypothetical protein
MNYTDQFKSYKYGDRVAIIKYENEFYRSYTEDKFHSMTLEGVVVLNSGRVFNKNGHLFHDNTIRISAIDPNIDLILKEQNLRKLIRDRINYLPSRVTIEELETICDIIKRYL